jgi:ribosomal 50S subunit-recycling heat shock protein
MKGPLGTLAAIVVTMLAVAASAHGAEPTGEQTRESYVAQVEPICKRDTLRSKRILKGAQGRIKQQKLALAGRQFLRVSETFGETIQQIVAVPRPPDDDARLQKWFGFLRILKMRLHVLGKTLIEGDRVKATHASIKAERTGNAANNVSFVFGFRYCRITRSRFG